MSIYLDAANVLINPDVPLHQRLLRFYASIPEQPPAFPDLSIPALQLEAARCTLNVVHHVQLLLDAGPDDSVPPAIGTRDLAVLRSLLTLLFQWGVNPLLARLAPLWHTGNDHSASLPDLLALSTLLSSLMSTLFPRGVHAQPPQTLITTTILHKHVPDLLRASMALAWLPKSLCPQDTPSLHTLRPSVLRLLEFLPLPQIMTDLGTILSSSPPPPTHVRKLCSSLLTKSLLRPGGVRALFAAVFGEHEGSDNPQLEKYERTAGILMTVPAGLKPEEYFAIIIPRLMEPLSYSVPATYRRAASFSISRMLDSEFSHRQLVSSLVSPIIHHPITHGPKAEPSEGNREGSHSAAPSTPSIALSIVTILLLNTDPSPVFITYVLSPIVPALYALIFHLDTMKASNPVFKESIKGLLATWGRVVETQDGVNTLWSVIRSERIYWEVDVSGNIRRGAPVTSTRPVLLTPEDISRGEEIMGENFLDLYPDPAHFVQYIKSLDRLDMASELFVKLLEVYHSVDTEQETDPSRGLLYLQLIVQMQTQLSDESSTTNILRKPEHILSFVKHVLGSYTVPGTSSTLHKAKHSRGLGLEDLRIVDEVEDFGDSDSDDESVELGGDQAENNMTGTAINLLLAILEANPELSARNAPVLNEIFSLLEPFSNDASESIRSLAREARMVMTARLASSSTSWSAPQKREEEGPQEIYQKALKLLQDPILPVRAHGLLLLRQLVSSRPRAPMPTTDAALVPAILSIFMQSVQDDDSYIFLNAVQGLSAMVDAFGKDVLGNLLETYTRNLSASSVGTLSKQEVDAKVRVGEALGQVIRRCGDALSVYADIIVPRLISVFRSSYAPTVLRTSAVSLLTECVKTSMVSVLRYIDDVAASMIDFLQVEMAPTVRSPPKDGDGETRKAEEHEGTEVLDSKPTAMDPKLPPLRRAVLHFWTSLLHELIRATYDAAIVERLPATLLKRAKVTLGYIASSDEDGIVRVMAREANEAIDQLNKATLGI